MSKEVVKTPVAPKCFAHRNIKKEFTKAASYQSITTQFHLELGENNKVVKIQDRNIDWVELANKDADKVGLANVLALAAKRGDPLNQFAFKDNEAMDTSGLDPMNPDAIKEAVNTTAAQSKLDAIAKQIGLTTEELVDAFIKGTLEQVIAAKLPKQEEASASAEGGKE